MGLQKGVCLHLGDTLDGAGVYDVRQYGRQLGAKYSFLEPLTHMEGVHCSTEGEINNQTQCQVPNPNCSFLKHFQLVCIRFFVTLEF